MPPKSMLFLKKSLKPQIYVYLFSDGSVLSALHVARGAVLLKPTIANILHFNLCEQKPLYTLHICELKDCKDYRLIVYPVCGFKYIFQYNNNTIQYNAIIYKSLSFFVIKFILS